MFTTGYNYAIWCRWIIVLVPLLDARERGWDFKAATGEEAVRAGERQRLSAGYLLEKCGALEWRMRERACGKVHDGHKQWIALSDGN
jgi:hypothetical protein